MPHAWVACQAPGMARTALQYSSPLYQGGEEACSTERCPQIGLGARWRQTQTPWTPMDVNWMPWAMLWGTTSWWPRPTSEPKKRHWTTKRRSKLVKQWPSLPFVWRAFLLRKYQDCHRGRKIAEGNSTANVDFDSFEASLRVRWHFIYWLSNSSLQNIKRGQRHCREPSHSCIMY